MLRPFPLKGKGFVLDYVTPHAGVRRATVAGRYAMTLDLADVLHRQIYMGCFANAMTRWAHALLGPGGVFLDVGAHIGYFSLIAADRVGREGRVLAVEPNPAVFAALRAHVTVNQISQIETRSAGLAEHAGYATLHVPALDSRRSHNATLLRRPGWIALDVPVHRLDDCLDSWKLTRVDLMKIDVEGSEPRVLAGGAAHLARGVVRHLMIEINGPRLAEGGSSPAALVDQLAALGFEPARLAGRQIVRTSRAQHDLDPTHERDCLFVHQAAAHGRFAKQSSC